uniref:Cordon-bleu ubiquitin-like domain-containing protein n=1 Tax=Xiphophorus couchianus TaxID=32473 RepID=A0A3B5MKM6_9TELE
MKVPAPPPPQAPQPAPRHLFRRAHAHTYYPDTLSLLFLFSSPSKPLMDLLVDLCGHHHLNPSTHTLELLSPDGHSLGFKPNALLGSFNVACVLIKEKVVEEKVTRRPAPKVPEKTVRLMVNFHGNQKAVLRVNPLVPLQALIPAICDKCDFDPAHVLLLKDCISRHELPLDKSLTELGIKELYVHDQSLEGQRKRKAPPPPPSPSPITLDSDDPSATVVSVSNLRSIEIPTPVPRTRTPQLSTFSDDSVVMQTAEVSRGEKTPKPPPMRDATPPRSSPSPSSSTTTDSLVVQDSSSELSRSLDDSDVDLDQAGSCCSTSSAASGPVQVQLAIKKSNMTATKQNKEKRSDSNSRSDSESALNLTLDEDTQTLAVKSSADLQKTSKPPVITVDLAQHNTQSFQQKKFELPAKIQRSVSPGKDEVTHKVNQISSSVSPLHGKITHNVTSRFGMKTFTVVPSKPSVTNVTKTEPPDSGGRFAIKIDDQGNMVAAGIPRLKSRKSPKSEIENGTPVCENAKALWSSDSRKENLKATPRLTLTEVESKISVSNNVQRPSNKPSLPPPLHSDRKQQLSFVKPSRRTSSQYVASALAQYTPKTSTKPSNIPKTTDSPDSLKTEKAESSKKPVTQLQSSQVSLSDITENDSASTVNAFFSSNSSGDYIKHNQPQIPSPTKSSALHSSFKPPIAPKTKPQDQIGVSNFLTISYLKCTLILQGVKDVVKEVKQQSSTAVSDSTETPGSVAGLTLFGPVKKFKPVICKSVEKDTSLHSSLMEAIQTGGGKEKLKKQKPVIATKYPSPNTPKHTHYQDSIAVVHYSVLCSVALHYIVLMCFALHTLMQHYIVGRFKYR